MKSNKGFIFPSWVTYILLLAATALIFWAGWEARGITTYKEVAKYRERETELLAQLNEKDKEREVIYRDKIKIVKEATGSCVDATIPDDVYRLLPGGSKTK